MIESFKEEGRLRRIEATILVERESQKLIVLGARASGSSAWRARRARTWSACSRARFTSGLGEVRRA